MKQSKISLFLAVALVAGIASGQKAKPDPKVKEALKSYSKLISDRKGAKDDEAIDVIDKLLSTYETMHPKDQASMAKGVAASLLSSRCKRKPTEDKLFRATIKALSMTGTNGSKYLAQAYEKKKFKDKEWLNLRASMLEHLGRCKDPKKIDFLLDEALKSPHDALMASAGGAMKHYADLKLPARKKIAKLMIKKFTNIYDNANKNLDPGDLNRKTWENRLAQVSDPWNTALQALTKQRLRSANSWNKFWNKHKDADWDKPLKTTR